MKKPSLTLLSARLRESLPINKNMPQTNFELINHAYSFSYSVTHSGGETYSLPQSDYGAYGHHVDAFFNSIPGTGQGGVSNLKAWFLSDLGLTWSLQAGATTQIYNYMEQRFPIDTTTTGRGLIDLRGSPDWKHVIGDGIIAPTTLAGTGETHPYTEGVKRVYDTLKSSYPNMEWAIAGLPHLPFFMTYAPDPSLSGQMEGAGQTPGFDWNDWDPNHPRGYYDQYYTWGNVPQSLADFYIDLYETGMQQTILQECNPDWLCFDVRVPHQKNFPFYQSAYLPTDNYERNKRVAQLAADYAQYYYKRSFAEISTVYPSRYDNPYDDPEYFFASVSGSSGSSGNATESYYPKDVLRYEMLQPAAEGGCHGFLFADPVPAMIEMACTASTAGLGDTGDSQDMIDSARNRARNMFSYILFGGSDNNGYEPDGGWTAGWVRNELRRFASNETIGMLDAIRESVAIGNRGRLMGLNNAGQNGWQRTIPPPKTRTDVPQVSTNTVQSDNVYGEQTWPTMMGAVDCTPCQCREPNPDWSDPVCCPSPETNPNCDCTNNPFAYGCCDPDSVDFSIERCCGDGLPFGPDDPVCVDVCSDPPTACEVTCWDLGGPPCPPNDPGFCVNGVCKMTLCDFKRFGCPPSPGDPGFNNACPNQCILGISGIMAMVAGGEPIIGTPAGPVLPFNPDEGTSPIAPPGDRSSPDLRYPDGTPHFYPLDPTVVFPIRPIGENYDPWVDPSQENDGFHDSPCDTIDGLVPCTPFTVPDFEPRGPVYIHPDGGSLWVDPRLRWWYFDGGNWWFFDPCADQTFFPPVPGGFPRLITPDDSQRWVPYVPGQGIPSQLNPFFRIPLLWPNNIPIFHPPCSPGDIEWEEDYGGDGWVRDEQFFSSLSMEITKLATESVHMTSYIEELQSNNIRRAKSGNFLIYRKPTIPIVNWDSYYMKEYSPEIVTMIRNNAIKTINNPRFSQDALRLFGGKDLSKHQNFGNFSP